MNDQNRVRIKANVDVLAPSYVHPSLMNNGAPVWPIQYTFPVVIHFLSPDDKVHTLKGSLSHTDVGDITYEQVNANNFSAYINTKTKGIKILLGFGYEDGMDIGTARALWESLVTNYNFKEGMR